MTSKKTCVPFWAAVSLIFAISVPLHCAAQTITLSGDHGPATYDGSNPWNVGGDGMGDLNLGSSADGHMTIDGTAGSAVVNGGFLLTAGGQGSLEQFSSNVVVTGSQARWNFSQGSIGLRGPSTLDINNGGQVFVDRFDDLLTSVIFGHNHTATGNLHVDGNGSELNVDGFFRLGFAGNSVSSITNGGKVVAEFAQFGSQEGSTGELTIDGVGSSYVANGNQSFGIGGTGIVNILNGGVMTSPSSYRLGEWDTGVGEVTVSGQGSQWNSLSIYLGGSTNSSGGKGTINISNGALVDTETLRVWDDGFVNLADGNLKLSALDLMADVGDQVNFTGGRLELQDVYGGSLIQKGGTLAVGDKRFYKVLRFLDGDYEMQGGNLELVLQGLSDSADYDNLDIENGAAILDGTIDINWGDGFVASLGDSFLIVDALNGISGTPTFDFSDAPLETGLFWDTSDFLNSGSISVSAVPEPSSAVLLLLAGYAGVARRRRASHS